MDKQDRQDGMAVEARKEPTIEENLSKLEDLVGALRSLLGVKIVASDRKATESASFSTRLIQINGRICELFSDVQALFAEVREADEVLH